MKWLLQNTRKRLAFAFRNPAYAVRSLYRELASSDEHFLARASGSTEAAIRGFLDEPINLLWFRAHLRAHDRLFTSLGISSADQYAKKVLIQFAAVRALQPEIVVETGIANGVSSAYVLLALQLNQKGRLHSIDIGDPSYLPDGKNLGWFVPDALRGRWMMHVGDSRSELPRLLDELGAIDIFIHDSLHTYEHMKFEFEAAYPCIRQGGLLLTDDALWNTAFLEFEQQVHPRLAKIIRGVGLVQK